VENLHPIQLKTLAVKKLTAEVFDEIRLRTFEGAIDLSISLGTNPHEAGENTVWVGMKAEVKPDLKEGEDAIFYIEVEISGNFSIDLNNFKEKNIDAWTRVNAPFLLIPYLREHVYGLSSRIGVKDLLLPLMIQPQWAEMEAKVPKKVIENSSVKDET